MKFLLVATFALVALMTAPTADAWVVGCSEYNRYKGSVNHWFWQRDVRINGVQSYGYSINRKADGILSTARKFSDSARNMDSFMSYQRSTNNAITYKLADLKARNVALKAELEKLRVEVEKVVQKNCQQDAHIITLLQHNILQDRKVEHLEQSNKDQQADIDQVKSNNVKQDDAISAIKSANQQQDNMLSDLQKKDQAQDSMIANLQSKNAAQDSVIDEIHETNRNQDGEIKKLNDVNAAQDKKFDGLMSTLKALTTSVVEVVKNKLSEFQGSVNKCIFSSNMLQCMFAAPPRPVYQYTLYSAVNPVELLEQAAGN